MSNTLVIALLAVTGLGAGVMTGVYFTFSAFVIKALGDAGPVQAVNAMNHINRVILRSAFMPLFFGSTGFAVLLAVAGVALWSTPAGPWMFAAGVLYCLGMFGCTALFNVPLNNELQSVPGASPAQAEEAWTRYARMWTRWNHVRTLASASACAICLGLLATG